MTRFALAALLATLAACAAPFAHAQPATAQSSLSFNLGAVSDYRYRGISQSRRRPAVQGGVDYSHAGGSASAEVDVYGGYKFAAGPLGLDVGALRYLYPGSQLGVNPDTTELYAAAKWGPATLKYSHALTNLFGFADSQGSGYLELGATFDTGVWGLSLTPHVGHQRVRRNGDFSYTDVALTLGKDFGNGVSASLALVGTDNDNYRAPNGRNLGKAGAVLGLKVAF